MRRARGGAGRVRGREAGRLMGRSMAVRVGWAVCDDRHTTVTRLYVTVTPRVRVFTGIQPYSLVFTFGCVFGLNTRIQFSDLSIHHVANLLFAGYTL